MAMEEVKAKLTVGKDEETDKPIYEEAVIAFDFGDDLDAAIALCGAEVVFSQYKSAAKVALQGIVRNNLKAGKSTDDIQAIADGWKPGMVMERTAVDPMTAVLSAFGTWDAEKQAAFLEQLGTPK